MHTHHQTYEIAVLYMFLVLWKYMKEFTNITTVLDEKAEQAVQDRQKIQYEYKIVHFDI